MIRVSLRALGSAVVAIALAAGVPLAQDAPARRLGHMVAVAMHEYRDGVAPGGGVREEDEHGEAVAFLRAARGTADSVRDVRRPSLAAVLDSMLRDAQRAAPHARLDALERRLMGLLGADAVLAVPAESDVARGAAIFRERCASCHGDTGRGDGPLSATLDPRPKALAGPETDGGVDRTLAFRVISVGIIGTAMPAFGSELTESDRWAVTAYLRALHEGAGEATAGAERDVVTMTFFGLETLFAGVWGALFIFLARIVDVSCDTMRVLFTVRGKRAIAGVLGFTQALVWIFAVGTAIRHLDSWMHVLAYAGGYAAGTMTGITIERFVAYGVAQVRIITRVQGEAIATALRDLGFGVTQTRGEGRSGGVDILHTIVQRSQVDEVLQVVDLHDKVALVTVEEPRAVRGGYVDTREWRVPLPWEKSRQRV